MLPKDLRLKAGEFYKIQGQAKKIISENYLVFVKPRADVKSKYIINVPKAVDKRATKRNRTKRVVEQFLLLQDKNISSGKNILIRAKKIITAVNRLPMLTELKNILENELRR